MGEIEVTALETEEGSERSRNRGLVSQALRQRSDKSIKERSISRGEALEANKSEKRRKQPQRMRERLRVDPRRRLHQSSLAKRNTKLKRRTKGTLKHREKRRIDSQYLVSLGLAWAERGMGASYI